MSGLKWSFRRPVRSCTVILYHEYPPPAPPQGDALERSMNCEVEAILRVYALARGETFARIVERGCTAPTR